MILGAFESSGSLEFGKPEISRTISDMTFCGFIGSSAPMRSVYRMIESAAPSLATVFIKGESGTGKELCADAVHKLSPRGGKALISLNCSAIPRELMESEIFGHEKGAFTGAVGARQGAAELAEGGTLFLDEICEMDLALQAKLLRFLQTGTIQRVGGNRERKVDVRIVCATNRDPLEEVRRGTFRADLFYRLHVLPIELPPLRDRGADILLIARKALIECAGEEGRAFGRFDTHSEELLCGYDWPGNVRELLNAIRHAVVMNDGDVLRAAMLPAGIAQAGGGGPSIKQVHGYSAGDGPILLTPNRSSASPETAALRPMWQHERDIIEAAISACGGNIGIAAAHLGISPSTIYRKRHNWLALGAA